MKNGTLGGAALDVYAVEPVPQENELWTLPNVLMTPHCADRDPEFMDRAMDILSDNLALHKAGKPLKNVCDKQCGY